MSKGSDSARRRRRGHAVGPRDLVAEALEQPAGRPGGVDVVLDQQDADPAGRAVGRSGRRRRSGRSAGRAIRGSVTTNVEPLPGPSLAARIVPPCRSTTALAIDSPRPRPPNCRVTAGSPCSKASKMCGSASGLIPLPVSRTSTSTRPSPAGRVATRIVPPAGVNFAAFFTRFQITCWSRAGRHPPGRGGRPGSSRRPGPCRGCRRRRCP